MPYPYPQRPQRENIPNAWQVAGGAFQDAGKHLGGLADKQTRLREGFQQLVERRRTAELERMDRDERKKREEAELEIRKREQDRREKEPKEYVPKTEEEAINLYRRKKEIDAEFEKPKPKEASEADKSRAIAAANAQKMTDVIWERIDRMWQKMPQESADAEEYATWRKGMAELQKELNQTELAAGMPVTQSPFTGARAESQSFRKYAQRAYPGKYPAPEMGGAPSAAPAAPAPTTPVPGQVMGGYRFKGGNPKDPNAWEPVQ